MHLILLGEYSRGTMMLWACLSSEKSEMNINNNVFDKGFMVLTKSFRRRDSGEMFSCLCSRRRLSFCQLAWK